MSDGNRTKIIRAIFAAYLSNDRKVVEDSLTDDFRFTTPYDDEIDKATYFERCWHNSDWIERHELEKIFVLCDLQMPGKRRQEFSQYGVFQL